MRADGYSDGGDQDAVGHPRPVLRLRVQQGAHRRLRPGLLLDRLPQGQLPGRVHGRAAHLGRATTRTRARSTCTSAGGWASRCCRRTSTSPTPTSPRAAPTSGSGSPRSATSASNVVESIVADPPGQGPVRRLPRLPAQGRAGRLQQEDRRVADQGRRVRLARPHPARAAARSTPTRSTRSWTPSAPRRSGSSTCSAATPSDDADGRADGVRRRRSRRASGTRRRCSRTSARCSASTSPTTRCSASSTCSPRPPTARSPRCMTDDRPDGAIVTVGGHRHRRCSARSPSRATPWAIATLEDLDGAIEVDVLPADLRSSVAHPARRGRRRARPRPGRQARGRAQADRDGAHRPGPVATGRAGRSSSRCRPRGARRRWSSGSRRCSPPIPGATEVHLQLRQRGPHHGAAARRPAAGHRHAGADGRPQGAARLRLPRRVTDVAHVTCDTATNE